MIGGGSGINSHILSLILNHNRISTKAYSYDIDPYQFRGLNDSHYLNFIKDEEIVRNAPYNVILFSHVLEHVSFPLKLIKKVIEFASRPAVVVVIVPYEQTEILNRKIYFSPHMQLFSLKSVKRLLEGMGCEIVKVGLINVLNKHWVVESENKKNLLGKTFIQKNIIGYGIMENVPADKSYIIDSDYVKSIGNLLFHTAKRTMKKMI